MYLAVIFGGKLPPKIAPKTKIAVIIVVNYYCKNGCSQRESNPQLALRRRLLYPFNYENKCRFPGKTYLATATIINKSDDFFFN